MGVVLCGKNKGRGEEQDGRQLVSKEVAVAFSKEMDKGEKL